MDNPSKSAGYTPEKNITRTAGCVTAKLVNSNSKKAITYRVILVKGHGGP
jgi:hypothetical protein